MPIRRFYSEDLFAAGYTTVNLQQTESGQEIYLDLKGKQNALFIVQLGTLTETTTDPDTGLETTTPVKEINPIITFDNSTANFSQGKILIVQGSTTLLPIFPLGSQGNFEINPNPNGTTILDFIHTDSGYVWNSSRDSSTYSLASAGVVDLHVDPVAGVNDKNPQTPYQTINYTIGEIKRLIPHSVAYPHQSSGYSGDRFIAVRVHLAPGTYALSPDELDDEGNPIASETVFAQYLNKYGIDFIGEGETPSEVIIYGNNSNDGIKLSNSCECNFKNLTISFNRSGIYVLDSNDISVENCIFENRSSNVRNAVFCYHSRIILKGIIELRGNFRRLINCDMNSVSLISCQVIVTPPTENPKPFEGFLSAFRGSDIYAENMTIPSGVPQGGNAMETDSPKCTIEMPIDIENLVYP
ncbi:right-handed parallel beta-helix repeat-containing protein [Coleofasciculus sp. E2-BRE-01]|uniref:right-handed parallel beta-helix repeat-containing protein n=1 Tax=Coleofasciculus sp. E2-BRE-01 TaxID=3069524 RepID=UPI0032FD3644